MISGDRWMFMWRSAPESWSVTQLVSQPPPPAPGPMPPPAPDNKRAPAQRSGTSALSALERLRAAVIAAVGELSEDGAPRGQITLERPRRAQFGDYSTNAALLLAPSAGVPPRELAERLGGGLQDRLGGGP